MLALTIKDRKTFTKEMFIGSLFDNFLLVKASIEHDITYDIDGRINPAFYGSEERANMPPDEYVSWSKIKPIATDMIKGDKLPISFTIVLKTTAKSLEILFNGAGPEFDIDTVEGLFINIMFKNEQILVTTGSSYSIFTMDKSLDHAFENAVTRLLASNNIEYNE